MHSTNNTEFVGKVFYILTCVHSTNTYALKLLAKTKPKEGTAILALEQTAGKGQFDRKWVGNKAENIYLSVIFYPRFLAAQQNFDLSRAIALAITDFLSTEFKLDARIKWPNDIYIQSNKICGILIENGIMGDKLSHSITGIGINVNQEKFSNNAPLANSLSNITGKKYQILDLTKSLFYYLEKRYLQLKENETEDIRADYDKLLFKYNHEVQFELKSGDFFTGTVKGTTPEGYLKVETSGGEKLLNHGEAIWPV